MKPTVETLRSQIADLHRERQTLLTQTRSRNEVRAVVESYVTEFSAKAKRDAHLALLRCAFGTPPRFIEVESNETCSEGFPTSFDLGPVLVAMLGAEQVKARLLEQIDTIPEGLDRELRATRLAEIAAELDELEIVEEQMIVRSEIEGEHPILRRFNARPEIVLPVITYYEDEDEDDGPLDARGLLRARRRGG